MLADQHAGPLIIVDIQSEFIRHIHEGDRVVRTARLLAHAAQILEIPVYATEHNRDRFGHLVPELQGYLTEPAVQKMEFSAAGPILAAFPDAEWHQATLVGVETHICMNQTALDLLMSEFDVFIPVEGTSSRSRELNELGKQRLRHNGVQLAPAEAIIYEWMGSADHDKFREVLKLVKEYNS